MDESGKTNSAPAGGWHFVSCPYCFGQGSLLGVICEECNGSGHIKMWGASPRSSREVNGACGAEDFDSIECPSCHIIGRVRPSAGDQTTHYCYECCYAW